MTVYRVRYTYPKCHMSLHTFVQFNMLIKHIIVIKNPSIIQKLFPQLQCMDLKMTDFKNMFRNSCKTTIKNRGFSYQSCDKCVIRKSFSQHKWRDMEHGCPLGLIGCHGPTVYKPNPENQCP